MVLLDIVELAQVVPANSEIAKIVDNHGNSNQYHGYRTTGESVLLWMYIIVVTHGHNADEESTIPELDSVYMITSSRATTYFGAITKPANSTVSNSKLGIHDRNRADSCANQSSSLRSHNR
ncbi:hypothetical protein KIW84_031986 [Lathyrus oleraceus]|uniref:Uncharacterized protein n=1 Tax=Pisum sativum TaxID=3888 RepID=A0A9D4XT81_PEA|nr:hypothetical protein KIW84_031986 [Pisum sativum]